MRLMFVYWQPDNAGSAQTIRKYMDVAPLLGHEVVLYAPPDSASRFECSLDIESCDAVIFLFEWNMYLHPGGDKGGRLLRDGLMGIGHVNVVKLLSEVTREQRLIIDDDGMYNDEIAVDGDYNHVDLASSRRRIEMYDAISDSIYQPTLHPLFCNVGSFLFHGYDPAWEQPLDFTSKEFGVCYVGSNWFRWRALHRVLRAIEPIRDQVGRISLVGHDWGAIPSWVEPPFREAAYFTDPEYLRRLEIEINRPVPVEGVIATMSRGVINPVLVRPVFNHLRLVNPRMFETVAANTIPLFALDKEHVREIYGDVALDLVLEEEDTEKILDVLYHPERYTPIVEAMRRRLAEEHSFETRVLELVSIVRGLGGGVVEARKRDRVPCG